jgi:hypothetical protein
MLNATICRLTQDVQNPAADRRYKYNAQARSSWPEGSLWRVYAANGRRMECIQCGDAGMLYPGTPQYDAVRPHLVPVESLERATGVDAASRETINAFLMLSDTSAKQILKYLWYTGQLSLDALRRAAEHLADLTQEEYDQY